jgi:hypothetical protein
MVVRTVSMSRKDRWHSDQVEATENIRHAR